MIAHTELDAADTARIQQLLRDGRETEAIRYYREHLQPTPGLEEAREAVEAMERQMGLAPAKTSLTCGLSTFFILAVVCLWLYLCIALLNAARNSTTYSGSTLLTPGGIAVRATTTVVRAIPIVVQPAPIASFGGEGKGLGRFDGARHITIDGNGLVYVSDAMTRRVQRFDENGKYLGERSIEAKGKTAQTTGPDSLPKANSST